MLKRHPLTLSLIVSFFLSANIFASTPLSCDQLVATHWVDTNDTTFDAITLGFNNDFGGLGYRLSYYQGRFGDGTYVNRCDVQPDGSILLTMPLTEDLGYLLLKTSDMQTFTVLPPSRLVNPFEKQIPIHGPFIRV